MSAIPDLVIRGSRVTLRPFGIEHITPRYLSWLNDPEVNRYSRRRDQNPIDEGQARQYIASRAPEEVILGIHLDDLGHVGNVKYGPLDRANSRADVSILIGERNVWGRGIGTESVYLVSRYLLQVVGLNRVDAGTCNPAFVKMVLKIGWQIEGVLQQRVRIGREFLPYTIVAQLASEFACLEQFENITWSR